MAVDRGPELASVLGLFLGLATVFVCLRFYVKTFLTKSWGSDDVFLIIALMFFTTYCACSATGVHYGTGRHVTDIPLDDIPKALYYWWLCELFYTLTTVFIRLSIAVFLLRICVKPIHKNIVYGTLTMVILFSIFYFFLVLFQCTPYSYFWEQYLGKKGSCINPAAVPDASIAHSVVSFTADWILGLLPIALIYDLKMNVRTKVSVAVLMGLGLLAGVAAMIRVPFIKTLALTDDFLFATTDVAIWSTVEPGLGIMAIGGATLRPLFRSFYNLSTRSASSHPHPSNWRKSNSRLGYIKNQDPPSQRQIQLRSDVRRKGTVTSIRSPFGDSSEVVGGGREGGTGKGGINVHKTVEVSSTGDGDSDGSWLENGSGSGDVTPVTPWPMTMRDHGDMA
ncbi:related to integral membrane protein [Phialocephala subalpina]|uniref:Related to integral membrane protein n=1 Tax=Phialocephala subalpina TaxID=576137 RepID=A0A1L7WDJ0_9HELO|nr:related to integral membrane protein [Phialocephala subalpina]